MSKDTATKKGARRTPRPSRTGLLARPVEVDLKISPILKRQWKQALAKITAAKREGAGAFDELWETVGQILEHNPPLYLAGGFSTAVQFLKEHVGENQRTAWRLIRVAKYASPAEEARYGVSKLDAALAYIEATTGGQAKGRLPVDFEKLRIPVVRDKTNRKVSLQDASVAQVRAAARKLRGAKGESRGTEPPAVTAIRQGLRAGGFDGIHVQLARGKISLSAIPAEAFSKVARVLSKLVLPGEGAAGRAKIG